MAQKAASGLFFDYALDTDPARSTEDAVRLCNDIFAQSADPSDLNTRLFCIRFVNFIFEHSELIHHRKNLSAYQWNGLQNLFLKDPSDPDRALALALYHLNEGEKPRALQLLDRLSRSGLRHALFAETIIRTLELKRQVDA